MDRVDIHHHFVPDFYREALEQAGGDPSGWAIPQWSKEADADFNKKHQIKTAFLSLTAPGAALFKGKAAADLARKANDYSAQLRDENPSAYGVLAALPDLLEKELVLQELKYAYDTLKVDGVTLFTRYGNDNHYLGHKDFDYLWQELDARSAVVFVHPTHAVDTNLTNPNLPQPVIDYPFETTKTAVDILSARILRRYKNVKIVLSHAGGTLPYLIGRGASLMPFLKDGRTSQEIYDEAREFYFDTALSGDGNALDVLKSFAKPDHVIYGSDFPYAPPGAIDYHTNGQDLHLQSQNDTARSIQINRTNGLKLFPRLNQD